MIVYQATKARFLGDTDNRDIEDVIATRYLASTGRYAPHAESNSWRESLGQMAKVLRDDEMPDDMGVGIEFGIPQSSKRIDFILTGRAADNSPNLIIVELKQWSKQSPQAFDRVGQIQLLSASRRRVRFVSKPHGRQVQD